MLQAGLEGDLIVHTASALSQISINSNQVEVAKVASPKASICDTVVMKVSVNWTELRMEQ